MLVETTAIAITCERYGKGWLVRCGDLQCVVEDSVGMSYLSVLLDNPGYEISALELAAGPDAASVNDGRRSEQPFLDEAAVRAYRARLASLRAEIDEYEAMHDPVRVERARVEYDWLVSELVSAAGLGGRPRRFADNEERARVSVGKAIRRAINRIAAAEPGLGEQLRTTVHTGMRCRYQPHRQTRPIGTAIRAEASSRQAAAARQDRDIKPDARPGQVGAASQTGASGPGQVRAASQNGSIRPDLRPDTRARGAGAGQPLAARASVGASRAARIAG